jgi:hypothetical protein
MTMSAVVFCVVLFLTLIILVVVFFNHRRRGINFSNKQKIKKKLTNNSYGQPSKRLTQIMGPPLTPDEVKAVPTTVQTNNGYVAGGGASSGSAHPPLQQAYPGYPY